MKHAFGMQESCPFGTLARRCREEAEEADRRANRSRSPGWDGGPG